MLCPHWTKQDLEDKVIQGAPRTIYCSTLMLNSVFSSSTTDAHIVMFVNKCNSFFHESHVAAARKAFLQLLSFALALIKTSYCATLASAFQLVH